MSAQPPAGGPSWIQGDVETDVPDALPPHDFDLENEDTGHVRIPDWMADTPLIGDDTEEIPHPVFLQARRAAYSERGWGDAIDDAGRQRAARAQLESDPVFGAAGTLPGERFNGRRMLRALVVVAWAITLGYAATAGFGHYSEIVPRALGEPMYQWVLLGAAAILVAAAVAYFATVDEPDIVEAGEDIDFHELEWSRRQLYAVRPIDIGWTLAELLPLAVFFLA